MSIAGRTLAFVKQGTSDIAICTSIADPDWERFASTQFVGVINGSISFAQQADMLSETTITVDLLKSVALIDFRPLAWYIRSNCSEGYSFNPYDVDIDLCQHSSNKRLCSVGDLTGKHGMLWENSHLSLHAAVYNDFDVPLSGPGSVIGANLAIVDPATNDVLSCAVIHSDSEPEQTAPDMTTTRTSSSPTFLTTTSPVITTPLPSTASSSTTMQKGILFFNHKSIP